MRLVIASILNFDINFLKSAGIERNKVYIKILGTYLLICSFVLRVSCLSFLKLVILTRRRVHFGIDPSEPYCISCIWYIFYEFGGLSLPKMLSKSTLLLCEYMCRCTDGKVTFKSFMSPCTSTAMDLTFLRIKYLECVLCVAERF